MSRILLVSAAATVALSASASNAQAAGLAADGPAAGLGADARPMRLAPMHALTASSAMAESRRRIGPAARIDAANRAATREPSRHGYVNASQVYAWAEGSLYRLYAAPERVSDIALQPGERLISVAAGDTVRWVIGDTASGAGAGRRTHILVKPSAAGLRTNLVIATDRRVYHVQLESTSRSAMASMSWTYPQDGLLALRNPDAAAEAAAALPDSVAIEALNFGYRISGDEPAWRPVRAFDDGRQVFIEFPPSLGTSEAPPLFAKGAGGKAELVNYRVRGRYYVVDRLFSAAELRLGERRQQVVRITKIRETRNGRRLRSS